MSVAEFSIKNRLISFIVIIVVLAGGWIAYGNMPRFEDPEFTIREAIVITQYPGASPEEVANEVTEPLETAIQQMPEVEEVSSVSLDGVSQITVEVKYGDSQSREALQLVWTKLRNRVRDAQGSLPPGTLESIVNDDFGDVYGIYYLITGEGYSPREIYEYARDLRTELLTVDGVARVTIQGRQHEAIYVEISRDRASALGASVDQVYNDLAQQNSVVSAGDVRIGDRRVLIRLTGEVDSVAAIENTVVSTPEDDTVIYLRDVANVRRDYHDPPSFVNRYNGEFAIGIGISNVSGANVVAMGEAIDEVLAESEGSRPIGMEVHEYYHQGKVTDAAVQAFAVNVLMALVIVLVTLFFFMGMRAAIIIGAVLVMTIAATLTTMYLAGIPMHRISLGALIIALGMLVDNAIVVTEGILVGVQQGRKKLDIAKEIVSRSKWPLLGGTLVGIIAFAPIGLAPGSTAEFTGHLFWVVLISLLFSWVFAISAVPLFADLLFKEVDPDEVEQKTEAQFLTRYREFMRGVLERRWRTIGIVAGLFVLSIFGFGYVKSGFFPASTTPQLVVDFWLPQGTDFDRTFEEVTELEDEVAAMVGVQGVNTLVGQGALRYMLVYPPESQNSAYGQLLLQVDYDQIDTLLPQIQKHIDQNYPDAQAKVWQFQLGPGGGSKIEAEFAGPDPAVLRRLATEAEAVFAADNMVTAIKNDWRQRISVIEPIYSEARGRRLGISREDLSNALRTNFSGRDVGVYREGDTLIPIVARAPAGERRDVQSIASVQIPSQVTGGTVPFIETVSGFDTVWRDGILRRIDRVPTIRAQADPRPGVLASVAEDSVRAEIEAIELPPGYSFAWRGESGDSAEANKNLASTLPLGLLAMVFVVVLLFNALRQPLIIWLVVPLAIIGVVAGLLVTGSALEFMAILGVLSLSGLLIKNAIVLVDQMDLEIREGKPRYDAVLDSAASRVRPVTMGSITTVLGILPLFGDAFFRSMAVVLIFGLSFATLLTLVVVPVLYSMFFGISSVETTDAVTEAET